MLKEDINMSTSNSASEKLTEFYCSFYRSIGKLAFRPYTFTYELAGGEYNPVERRNTGNYTVPVLVCGALTLTLILPALTLITMGLALIGMLLAMLSSAITYPVANMYDCHKTRKSWITI